MTSLQEGAGLARYTLRSTPADPPDRPRTDLSGKQIVIIGDQTGFGAVVAARFETAGACPSLLDFSVDQEPAALLALLDQLHARNETAAGLMVCLTSAADQAKAGLAEFDPPAWRGFLDLCTVQFLHVIKAVGADLRTSRGWVAAVTMGGARGLPSGDVSLTGSLAHAAAAGFLKALVAEWPDVCCKAIDVCSHTALPASADLVIGELGARDPHVEISFRHSRRFVQQAELEPVPAVRPVIAAAPGKLVILATGGARGITAEILRQMAHGQALVLHLVGRSELPAGEAADTEVHTDPAALRATILQRQRRGGGLPTPAGIEKAVTRILQNRDIRTNIAALRSRGCTVVYHPLDICDVEAFGALIDGIYRTEGRIDGVIHGAGIIDDRPVESKRPDMFSRVVATKVDAAFALASRLRPKDLKFLVFFTSVAGVFGNQGQTDYCSANEILNALARHLGSAWPNVAVRAINWGPWSKGMASPQVQAQMTTRGVQVINPESGQAAFAAELACGVWRQAEVILGDGPWRAALRRPSPTRRPLLGNHGQAPGQPFELLHQIDPANDPYLDDHRLDGRCVLPVAMHVELMAEAALSAYPVDAVVGVDNFQLLNGIVLAELEPRLVRISGQLEAAAGGRPASVQVSLLDAKTGRPSSRATILLQASHDAAPVSQLGIGRLQPPPFDAGQAYERMLFHGPRLRSITEILGVNERGIAATLRPSKPEDLLNVPQGAVWTIDPAVLDGAFQLAILWIRHYADMMPLPSRFRRLALWRPVAADAPINCELRATHTGPLLETDIILTDRRGRLVARLDGMEFACSRALNRLAGGRGNTAGSGEPQARAPLDLPPAAYQPLLAMPASGAQAAHDGRVARSGRRR